MKEIILLRRTISKLDAGGDYNASDDVDTCDVMVLAKALRRVMAAGADNDTCSKDTKHVLVSIGRRGLIWVHSGGAIVIPAVAGSIPIADGEGRKRVTFNTNGCGDALFAGVISSCLSREADVDNIAVEAGVLEAYNHMVSSNMQ